MQEIIADNNFSQTVRNKTLLWNFSDYNIDKHNCDTKYKLLIKISLLLIQQCTNAVEPTYNVVYHNAMSHIAWQWKVWATDHSVGTQRTLHTNPSQLSYEVSFVSI